MVGRDVELAEFDVAVQRLGLGRPARSLMLTGFRGVGKTVLLTRFGRIARKHDWVHQQIEATARLQFPKGMAAMTRKAILRLSGGTSIADRAKRVLKSFQLRWQVQDGRDLMVGLDPELGLADSGDIEEDLADLFIEVGRLAESRGRGVLFTVDEIQCLALDELTALIVGLHRVSQEQLPVMVTGAGLPSLPALAGEARSYAERLFSFRGISNLEVGDAERALAQPAADEGVRWHPDALERVVAETQGYPYFLQEFGKQAWNVADGPDFIGPDDVDKAIPIITDELDTGFFRVRFRRTTHMERAYLSAMASLGDGPYRSGAVAATQGKTTTQVGPLRDAVIKKGLCYSPSHGLIDFTVPMFGMFIRRELR